MDKKQAKKIYNKYINATHRQHFVKKEYLQNWSFDGINIFGKRRGDDKYRTYKLKDVCVRNDIYSINHHYNELELSFLKRLYSNYPPFIRDEINDLIKSRQFQTSSVFTSLTKGLAEGDKLIKGFQNQSGEDYQTRIENAFFDIVKKYAVNNDDSFLDDIYTRTAFIIGLATQYMRTDKMRTLMKEGIDSLVKEFELKQNIEDLSKIVNAEALWRGTLEIMPFLLTYQLNKERYGIEFIHSNSAFITSDSPVVHVGQRDENGYAKNVVFLYPVNPSLCIIYPSETLNRVSGEVEIARINGIISNESHNFIFKVKE